MNKNKGTNMKNKKDDKKSKGQKTAEGTATLLGGLFCLLETLVD